MDPKERKLMIQIAKDVDSLKAWRQTQETKPPMQPVLDPTARVSGNQQGPIVLVGSVYAPGFEQSGVARANEVHTRIREALTQICKAENIKTLQISYIDQ